LIHSAGISWLAGFWDYPGGTNLK